MSDPSSSPPQGDGPAVELHQVRVSRQGDAAVAPHIVTALAESPAFWEHLCEHNADAAQLQSLGGGFSHLKQMRETVLNRVHPIEWLFRVLAYGGLAVFNVFLVVAPIQSGALGYACCGLAGAVILGLAGYALASQDLLALWQLDTRVGPFRVLQYRFRPTRDDYLVFLGRNPAWAREQLVFDQDVLGRQLRLEREQIEVCKADLAYPRNGGHYRGELEAVLSWWRRHHARTRRVASETLARLRQIEIAMIKQVPVDGLEMFLRDVANYVAAFQESSDPRPRRGAPIDRRLHRGADGRPAPARRAPAPRVSE